jgi:hypothetical protein
MMPIAPADSELERAVISTADSVFAAGEFSLDSLAATGFAGLGVAESAGGSGGTLLHGGLVASSAGRQRVAIGYLQQLLSVHAAAACDDVILAQRLVGGEVRGAVGFEATGGHLLPLPVPQGWDDAELVIHIASADGSVSRLAAGAFDRDAITWLDPEHVDVQPHAAGRRLVNAAWPSALSVTNGLVAAGIVGLVEGLLTETLSYVKQRQQFGLPVGSFQAVKHSLADVHIDLVHTRALAFGALRGLSEGDERAPRLAGLAKLSADATALGAQRCLQAMGGIGFTWESRVHVYLKAALRLRQWPQPHAALRTAMRPTRIVAG